MLNSSGVATPEHTCTYAMVAIAFAQVKTHEMLKL